MTMRSMSLVEQGGNFTYEGSAEKVWAPEHGVRTTETITQILGPYAQLLNGSEGAIEDGLFAHNVMGAFQSGINHGSVQVMRDQMARPRLGNAQGLIGSRYECTAIRRRTDAEKPGPGGLGGGMPPQPCTGHGGR